MTDLLLAWFKYDIGEGAFDAVFGYLFVFLGIALLVTIFTIFGIVMRKVNGRKPKKKKVKDHEIVFPRQTEEEEGEIPEEVVAVIMAAISAVYEGENTKCDFVVRRIKRL